MVLLSYQEMLDKLPKDKSHLLLGNGFNLSLGVNTSYKDIINRMIKDYPIYKMLETELSKNGFDIELIIGMINCSIITDNKYKDFLQLFLLNKIKADFMKAAISIVTDSIKEIYNEKNEDIYLLFQKFNNYFTINYDPLLYLLLMKFKTKTNQDSTVIAFKNQPRFIEEMLDPDGNEILNIIRTVYNIGNLTISYQDNQIITNLNRITKTDFKNQIKKILKPKYHTITDKTINKATNQFFELLSQNHRINNVNDGFQGELFNENSDNSLQNVFFLHGAFHIYKKGKKIRKITQTSEQALYQRLEEIIEDENQEVICILEADNKEEKINSNEYLSKALKKLTEIEGELVIFGSALSENDNHIFNRINKNEMISKVYISTNTKQINESINNANRIFPRKEIEYFDYTTVSYNSSEGVSLEK